MYQEPKLTRLGVIDLVLVGVVGRLIDDGLIATEPDLSRGNRCGDTARLSGIPNTQSKVCYLPIKAQNRVFQAKKAVFFCFCLPCSFFGAVEIDEKENVAER